MIAVSGECAASVRSGTPSAPKAICYTAIGLWVLGQAIKAT